jgi:hypothetical protein
VAAGVQSLAATDRRTGAAATATRRARMSAADSRRPRAGAPTSCFAETRLG